MSATESSMHWFYPKMLHTSHPEQEYRNFEYVLTSTSRAAGPTEAGSPHGGSASSLAWGEVHNKARRLRNNKKGGEGLGGLEHGGRAAPSSLAVVDPQPRATNRSSDGASPQPLCFDSAATFDPQVTPRFLPPASLRRLPMVTGSVADFVAGSGVGSGVGSGSASTSLADEAAAAIARAFESHLESPSRGLPADGATDGASGGTSGDARDNARSGASSGHVSNRCLLSCSASLEGRPSGLVRCRVSMPCNLYGLDTHSPSALHAYGSAHP